MFVLILSIYVPKALEPRNMTRMEVRKFARAAWDLGVRYIGGCCGFEPHHIRAIAQEVDELIIALLICLLVQHHINKSCLVDS